MKKLTTLQIKKFQKIIYTFYKNNHREFVWRTTTNPYHIVVSEIMLQQTQTKRVEKKYPEFIKKFPTWKKLASAAQSDVLRVWHGMGYNRRALALQSIAREVVTIYKNKLPLDTKILQTFKGIGPNTAGSISAFAFNLPAPFIETNIRTVFIHHFFAKRNNIHDQEILPLVVQTIDTKNPRKWYYALMDYGVYLKKNFSNPSTKSIHHIRQSKFIGSDRQIRGVLIRLLLTHTQRTKKQLLKNFKTTDHLRCTKILKNLIQENFIIQKNNFYSLK
jgi:A/G-specific adenine glycosylase